ncbi:Spy/CpxP family protein refolding chaperone [Leptothoe sp. ISB3NOV94-8A]
MAQSSSTIVLDLGLTDAQIFQLNEVSEDYSPQIRQLYSEWLAATDTLDTLLVSEAATEAEVTTQFQNVESLRSELATSEFERDLAIWKILEPEQRLPFEQYFEQLNQQ